MGIKTQNFDLHVVADNLPPRLEADLLDMGYEPKVVIGGDLRVRMQHLLSCKAEGKDRADTLFKSSVTAIESHPSFVGYIEEEAVAYDMPILTTASKGEVEDFPEQYRVDDCPPGIYKKCDIHVAVPYTHKEVTEKLLDAGFYYLNLFKAGLGSVNVTTIQADDILTGKHIWGVLTSYLQKTDGFNGFAKFEVTAAIKNYGFKLPPIVISHKSG
jgi:hypothetical protein